MNDSPAPLVLRPLLAFALIALCLGLSSCQCSWKPDVGPVEDEEASIERLGQPRSSGALAHVPVRATA